MIHALKTYPEFFEAETRGIKPFEVRINDRDYKVGDYLALNEYDPTAAHEGVYKGEYTGRSELVKVVYILDDEEYCKTGFVVMGIEKCQIFSKYEAFEKGFATLNEIREVEFMNGGKQNG